MTEAESPSRTAAQAYRRFAMLEAKGVSDTYFGWAIGVSDDAEMLSLVEALPPNKQQPNLIFAAARFAGARPSSYPDFKRWAEQHWEQVVAVVKARSTQTNEAARCAVLLPTLAKISTPLMLIEVGASAGLCLFPDRYSYRYATGTDVIRVDPPDGPSTVVIDCSIDRESIPARVPDVVGRAGVDLNPLHPDDPDARAWLRTLIWPEHQDRLRRLDSALDIAAEHSPHVAAGDLLDVVPDLIAGAPSGAHTVVFHSAVLTYLEPVDRARFSHYMRTHPEVTWISNEAESVLPRVAARLPEPANGRMVVAVNEQPVAYAAPHGQTYQAIWTNPESGDRQP